MAEQKTDGNPITHESDGIRPPLFLDSVELNLNISRVDQLRSKLLNLQNRCNQLKAALASGRLFALDRAITKATIKCIEDDIEEQEEDLVELISIEGAV